jgi:hypothetical protein
MTTMVDTYGKVDEDDIKAKLDAIKCEPKQRVQKYYDYLNKFFLHGKW